MTYTELDFEKAAILRDRIKSLNIIQSSQRINEANLVEADVIAGYKESGKPVYRYSFTDLNKIGAIKLIILLMTNLILLMKF